MPTAFSLSSATNALRRAARVAARPVRRAGGERGLVIQTYRGYGTQEEVYLMGRVYRQLGPALGAPVGSVVRDVLDIGRRMLRWGVSGARLEARFGGATQTVTTDHNGYFRVRIKPDQAPDPEARWHTIALELTEPAQASAQAEGYVYIPPADAERVIISDIDDTVMETGVANMATMLYRLFAQDAESRTGFPGVTPLYRALHDGTSGAAANPMLYVSRGPWSIYSVLEAFFQMHQIPVGPVLFLREWGLTLQHPLPRRSEGHKLDLIRTMLGLYADRPFILIGDSGQHDAETYAQVVREHPGRIEAIYIRNVSPEPERAQEIEQLAEEVAEAGSTLLLAADSVAMAEHAAEAGFISPDTIADVRAAWNADAEALPRKPVREADSEEQAAQKAVRPAEEVQPPNVVFDPDEEKEQAN